MKLLTRQLTRRKPETSWSEDYSVWSVVTFSLLTNDLRSNRITARSRWIMGLWESSPCSDTTEELNFSGCVFVFFFLDYRWLSHTTIVYEHVTQSVFICFAVIQDLIWFLKTRHWFVKLKIQMQSVWLANSSSKKSNSVVMDVPSCLYKPACFYLSESLFTLIIT